MIECIVGSIIGTLIGLVGSLFVGDYMINKEINKIKKLISLSKSYKGFTGNNVDKTIFIYRLSSK